MDPVHLGPCGLNGTALPRQNRRKSRVVNFNLNRFISDLDTALLSEGDVGRRIDLLHASDFAISYLKSSLLSKYSDGTATMATFDAAMERFHKAEVSCALVNQRFASYNRRHGDFDPYIRKAKNIITDILGNNVQLDLIASGFGFGPGASTRLPRLKGDVSYKFSGHPETTLGNLPYAIAAHEHHPAWTSVLPNLMFSVVNANKITTVPKNAKTDRCIAIEPCMNMYIQKGFGNFIRRRLRKAGINLNDQGVNQQLAYQAFSKELATIDLSMASDTVSKYLVRELLPPSWYEHLNNVRSHYGVLPSGGIVDYQKFSSMGNGFTFELESLIFLALCRAVVPEELWAHVAVYGDDIIVPAEHADPVIRLLSYCGFATNEDKSFTSGPFYESCGKHFYEGHDVTPFYIKAPVKDIQGIYILHNQLTRWVNRTFYLLSDSQLSKLRSLLNDIRHCVASRYRIAIPDNVGDGGFLRPYSEIEYRKHKRGWDFYSIRYRLRRAEFTLHEEPGLFVKAYERLISSSRETEELPLYPINNYAVKYYEGKIDVPKTYYFHFDDLDKPIHPSCSDWLSIILNTEPFMS